jgi:hypothetical protein
MRKASYFRSIVSVVVMASTLFSTGLPAAEGRISLPAVRDVALRPDGSLRGTVMTAEGKPQANADVVLRKGTEVVASTKTHIDGSFTLKHVRPGVYELATAGSASLYRVWTTPAAPPAALASASVVEAGMVVRGQEEWSPVRRGLILGGIIVTSGVIGGVIGYNIKDDDSAS